MPAEVATTADLADLQARVDELAGQPAPAAYDDTALKAMIADLAARPDDDIDDEARARIAALEAKPTGTGAPAALATPFASFGADDTQRFVNLIAAMKSGWKGEVQFEARTHNCPIQIPTLTDTRWVGTATRAGEWGSGTIINYTGPADTSMFLLYKNAGYSYPANGVSRNANFQGIQWRGGLDRDFLPSAPGSFDSNYVQWYWQFRDCGWVGWRRIFNGWGNGLDLAGFTHFQGNKVTPLTLGGSECKWFLGGGFMDSDDATWKQTSLPLIACSLDKSVIGSAMLSARGNSYQLKVTYGSGTRCIGTEFDAPDGAPTLGHQVRFDGTAKTFNFEGCSFKGGSGIRGITGPTEIGVDGCTFHGNRELARLEAGFSGVLLWGSTNTYGACPRVIYAARASQVICTDPRVTVKSLDGATVLQAATR